MHVFYIGGGGCMCSIATIILNVNNFIEFYTGLMKYLTLLRLGIKTGYFMLGANQSFVCDIARLPNISPYSTKYTKTQVYAHLTCVADMFKTCMAS